MGFPAATGPDGTHDPVNHVLPAWDMITGQMAVAGLLAAERHRRLTGEGQLVKLPLADVAMAAVGNLGKIAEVFLDSEAVAKLERATTKQEIVDTFGRVNG